MTTVFQVIQRDIGDKLEMLEEALVANRADSLEDYRYMTGQYRGLKVAQEIVKGYELKFNNDEDID